MVTIPWIRSSSSTTGMARRLYLAITAATSSGRASRGTAMTRLIISSAIGEVGEEVGGLVGGHRLEDVGGALVVEPGEDLGLHLLARLLEGVGRGLVVEAGEDGLAVATPELADDLGDVRRVHLRQLAVADAQLHRALVAVQGVDRVPADHPLGEVAAGEPAQPPPHVLGVEPAEQAAGADVHADEEPRAVARLELE